MYKQAIKFKKTENIKNKALKGPVRVQNVSGKEGQNRLGITYHNGSVMGRSSQRS